MPCIRGAAVRTPFGDAATTLAALADGQGTSDPLPDDLLRGLIDLAAPLVAEAAPDLVLFATTKGDLTRWCADLLRNHPSGDGGPAWCAGQLAAAFGCPAIAVSAACASSTVALGVAARRLVSGGAQRILVLAAERPTAFITAGFASLRAIDPAGCRPFHSQRNGLVPGAALAALVLDRDGPGPWLSGWGARMDANHLTGPDRSGSGLAAACRQALRAVVPAQVVAHGTGTRYNDDAESLAYEAVCPDVPVTAFKGLLGHSLGACGLVDVVLALTARQRRRIPGTVGTATPGCAGAIRLLPPGEHPLAAGPILIANAGFGGLNGAVVISDSPPDVAALHHAQQASWGSPLPARVELDHLGWSSGGQRLGTWSEPAEPGTLPRLSAHDVLGNPDNGWGRLDLASRALVALANRLQPMPEDTAVVLLSDSGCAASDRQFELARLAGQEDPQRFPYTLPSTPVGEVSIRLRLRGTGLCLLGADESQGRAIAADLLTEGAAAVLLARVEADRPPHRAWAELWTRG